MIRLLLAVYNYNYSDDYDRFKEEPLPEMIIDLPLRIDEGAEEVCQIFGQTGQARDPGLQTGGLDCPNLIFLQFLQMLSLGFRDILRDIPR